MKIGIVDDMFYSLQNRLMLEGNTLVVFVPSCQNLHTIPAKAFNVCETRGKIKCVASLEALIKAKCDLYIVGTGDHECYEILTGLGLPAVGYSRAATALEHSREYALAMLKKYKVKALSLGEARTFHDADALRDFLSTTKKKWVLKQSAESPLENITNRTVVCHDVKQTLGLLNKPNAWFNAAGDGGVRLEEYFSGYECCFGAWFDGEKFLLPIYSCIEHKGAQDGERGGIMTGEVGTTMKFYGSQGADPLNGTRVSEMFSQLEPMLKGTCKGMIDVNTIYDPETNKLNFLEFTCRFGRPTLEMQIAMLAPYASLGAALLDTLTGYNTKHLMRYMYREDCGVGVTVFSYGYPLLDELVPKSGADPEYYKKATGSEIEFHMPNTRTSDSKIVQQWCIYSEDKKSWVTAFNTRQFLSVGFGESWGSAKLSAYTPLNGYNLLGHTWRGDVGDRAQATEDYLIAAKVLPE